jgi:hypothetical protein
MRDNYIDKLLNPSDEELNDDMSARSSVEEQWPSKPLVAGSTPAGRDIQTAQLNLAKDVSLNLIRDCPEHTRLAIQIAFSSAIEQLEL